MAFDAKEISPIDFKKDYAVGINLPFSSPSVFYQNYTTQDAIKNNLKNYFLTNIGERYLFPTFGGDLRNTLFNPLDDITTDALKSNISFSLTEYFPSVEVVKLEITADDDNQQLIIYLRYNIINTGIEDTLEFKFE